MKKNIILSGIVNALAVLTILLFCAVWSSNPDPITGNLPRANLKNPFSFLFLDKSFASQSSNEITYPRYRVIGKLIGADCNSTADQAIPVTSSRWILDRTTLTNCSTSLTIFRGGVYNATLKPAGGILVGATQSYSGCTTPNQFAAGSAVSASATDIQTATTIYWSPTTVQAAPATADVYIWARTFD